jgi:hypothetical protein
VQVLKVKFTGTGIAFNEDNLDSVNREGREAPAMLEDRLFLAVHQLADCSCLLKDRTIMEEEQSK